MRVLPVGDSAVSVELGDGIDSRVNARVRALDRALSEHPFPGFHEAVPTYRSLLVVYDSGVGFEVVREAVQVQAVDAAGQVSTGRLRTIPTRYGGEDGPDLEDVARARGLSVDEVVALHTGTEYQAFMLGFMPGFAYLGLLPPVLDTPRRSTPRPRVPAGSVGIAGRQTGVYPVTSPGGWSLIGRTSLRLFDHTSDPPALVLPGDRVRFVPVSDEELPPIGLRSEEIVAGPASLEVLDGGLLTTVQDAGRPGYRRLGVTWAGPMDAPAHRAANQVLGNPPGAAALECTVAGPRLRFLATLHLAVTGADLGAVLHRDDLGAWPVPLGARVLARAGNVLSFAGRRTGCRAYVALAGGIEVVPVLGSRATDSGSGFGGHHGRALRAGDRLAVGPAPPEPRQDRLAVESPSDSATVRVVLGPQDDYFTGDAVARFLAGSYRVGATSDRVGCRLTGPPLPHAGAAEVVSDGMVPGSIQVPPDGQPIVMMADAPTTGGYPKIGTVVAADLPRLAQLLPGEGRVTFAAVTLQDVQGRPSR